MTKMGQKLNNKAIKNKTGIKGGYLIVFWLLFLTCGNFLSFSQDIPQGIIEKVEIIYRNNTETVQHKLPFSIKYNANSLKIYFYTHTDNLSYRLIQKNNPDSSWFDISVVKTIKIINLAAGDYKFTVRHNDNRFSEDLNFKVKREPWRTGAFIVIYTLFILIIFYSGFLYRSWNLIQANRRYQIRELTSMEVAKQKEELAVKNKNITDSINYARRIQLAMIPSARYFSSILPLSFIFYKPKDIVSGDFFWVNQNRDKIFVAAVDCTGHGVPGAFMSIIGIELLRKIINNQGIEEPSVVLNELNKNFAEIFKDVDNFTLRDGMDIAFCTIDRSTRILEFAGAFNPLYLIRDSKLTEIKGDRFSVGLDDLENSNQVFTNHHIQLLKDDMIYIFTDGYADQFGGEEGKKYKYRRFRHLLLNIHTLPLHEQKEHLERSIEDWRGENDQVDDILIIGMKIDF